MGRSATTRWACPTPMAVDAYTALVSLRQMLTVERQEALERIGSASAGNPENEQRIGRCKALKWTIEKINEQIRSINGDDEPKTS